MHHEILVNPLRRRDACAAGSSAPSGAAWDFHRAMPGYAPTRLVDARETATELGVARVLVKDEGQRLGLPSFKILGASWATYRAVLHSWFPEHVPAPTLTELPGLLAGGPARGLVAATDGNHGRGVARMAALLGLRARVLVPVGTVAARIRAIEGEGAEVTVVAGTYDDAVARSAELADADHLVVSDTSWPGYEQTPRDVITGYDTLFAEAAQQTADMGLPPPDVLGLQAGVGAFAAAGISHLRRDEPAARVVVVEPASASCLLASARAGRLTEVPGPHDSVMAGLNCGLPSLIAWPQVSTGTDVFLAVDDDAADEAARVLARDGIAAGESGAAGLAGLLAAARAGTPAERELLGLRGNAGVLLVCTEGPTDEERYRRVLAGSVPGTARA